MNFFNKRYFERCKEEFGEMGFVRNGSFFIRVVNNDIIQSFGLQKWGSGYKCEIHFSITPLCKGDWPGFPHDYQLKKYLPFVTPDLWCCKGTDEEVSQGVENVISDIKKIVIPLFEKTVDSDDALDELICFEKKVYGDDNIRLADNSKYFFALKNENYEFAAKCLEAFLKEQLYIYERCKACSEEYEGYPKENIANYKEEILRIEEEIGRMEKGDYDCFRKIVNENEEKNRELYKKFFPKKKA